MFRKIASASTKTVPNTALPQHSLAGSKTSATAPTKRRVQLSRDAIAGDPAKQRSAKQLDRLQRTSKVVELAKWINFIKTSLPVPTAENTTRLAKTVDTLAQCVNYTKKKVDDGYIERLTRPGHEDPNWQEFARKAKVDLPKRRTPEEQERIRAAREAQNEQDEKLPVAERVNKYIRAAETAKQKRASAQKTKDRLDVLTSGLDTKGDPRLKQAEEELSDDERRLAPLLSSVEKAFECSHALLLQLSADTAAAQQLSSALTTLLTEQKADATLQGASLENLPGLLLVQPFTRLGLFARDFKERWNAAEAARKGLEDIRAAGGEPTAEQLEDAAKAQRLLRCCAQEVIKVYDDTFSRLLTAGKLFGNAGNWSADQRAELFKEAKPPEGMEKLFAEQLTAVHEYGAALLDYAARSALPSSALMQLKAMAHSVVKDNATDMEAQRNAPATSSDNAATGNRAPQPMSRTAPNGKPAEQASALVVKSGVPVSPIQLTGGRISKRLPLPPVRGFSPAAA